MSNSGAGYGQEGFTDYEDQLNWDTVGSPVPLGDYDVEVVKAEYKPTSAGKHMAKIQFKIESAYDQANEEKSKDRLVFENFVFTQEAGFRVKNFAEAAGIDLPTIVSKQVIEEWAASIVGVKVGINVKHREWQGSLQASVGKCFPYQSGGAVAQEQQTEEQQAEEQQAEPEEASAPAPKPQSTLRQAVPQTNKANGTNGAHKPAAAKPAGTAPKPAAKPAKPQTRR